MEMRNKSWTFHHDLLFIDRRLQVNKLVQGKCVKSHGYYNHVPQEGGKRFLHKESFSMNIESRLCFLRLEITIGLFEGKLFSSLWIAGLPPVAS